MEFFKGCLVCMLMMLIAGMLLFIDPSWPLAAIVVALLLCILRLTR